MRSNAGMASRLGTSTCASRKSPPQLEPWFALAWLAWQSKSSFTPTCLRRWNRQCSEKSAYKIQTPENYPEESIQHSEHGESLKSRIKTQLKPTASFQIFLLSRPSNQNTVFLFTEHLFQTHPVTIPSHPPCFAQVPTLIFIHYFTRSIFTSTFN